MDAKEFAVFVSKIADDRKAEQIRVVEVGDLSGITDYFVIVTGTSEPHLKAIVAELQKRTQELLGRKPNGTDGKIPTNWFVLDYFDVIVHVMTESARSFYSLESLWKDAPQFSYQDLDGSAGGGGTANAALSA